MPKFSVIIPLYNKEHHIKNTIQSVLQQSFNDFELLIINDGSTDSSVPKVKEFTDSRIRLEHQENKGVSVARNNGIQLAKGTYICFLDADDFWYPNFLETFNKLITKYSDCYVFSAAFEVETKWNTFVSRYSITDTKEDLIVNFFDASKKETVLWTSCAVFHKSVFDNVGMFDATIKIAQDTDLWIRIGLHYPIAFTWNVLAIYKYDEHSLSKRTDNSADRLNFKKFEEVEKTNPKLKAYLDTNRYFMAMHSKMNNNDLEYKLLRNQIYLASLPFRRQIFLYTPKSIIKILLKVQQLAVKLRLSRSIFK